MSHALFQAYQLSRLEQLEKLEELDENGDDTKRVRVRSAWVASILTTAKREQQGAYNNWMRELALEDPEKYRRYVRMDTDTLYDLLRRVEDQISKSDTVMRESVPAGLRLACTIRFLATGESFASLEGTFRVSQCLIGKFVPEVCLAIYKALQPEFMQFPSTAAAWKKIAEEFFRRWNYPLCIGALDGKHFAITAPPNSGSYYFNYKRGFSINVLVLCDADYKALYVDAGTNGHVGDAGVWHKSSLKRVLESGEAQLPPREKLGHRQRYLPYHIVADQGFAQSSLVMRPWAQAAVEGNMRRKIFNYRLSRARRIVENFFGILVMVWRVFQSAIPLAPNKVEVIVLACCALHNYLRVRNACNDRLINRAQSTTWDSENTEKGQVIKATWRTEDVLNRPNIRNLANRGGFVPQDPVRIRDELADYFSNEGQVSFQERMWNLH